MIGASDKIVAKDITIANKATNAVYPVKSVSVDGTDKTKVYFETYASIKDGGVYTVTYDNKTVEFTATDGKVADVAISTQNITKGTAGTEVKAQLLDKDQIVTDEYTVGQASTVGAVDFTITSNKGYMDGNKLVLLNTGDTATAKVTYHTFEYDTTGAEKGVITKEFTITAVDDASTVSNWNYTVEKSYVSFVNWNTTVEKKTTLAVNDTANAFFYFKDSNGNDVTTNYSIESSDNSVLLLGKTPLTSAGAIKGSNAVVLTGVKDGTAYINVIKDDKVVTSLPVTVTATRKLTDLTFGSTVLTVSKTTGDLNTVDTSLKGFDQYTEETGIASVSGEVLSAPAAAAPTYTKGSTIAFGYNPTSKTLTSADMLGAATGDYQIKITATSAIDGNVKVSRVIKLTVVDTTGATASYGLDYSATSMDLAVSSSATVANVDRSLSVSVATYKKGAKVATVTGATITVKKPDGSALTAAPGTRFVDTTSTDGKVTLDLVGHTGSTVTKKYASWEMGNYTVIATFRPAGATADTTFTGSFELKDTQTAAYADVKKNKDTGVTSTYGVSKEARAQSVLANSSVVDIYYDGVKQLGLTTTSFNVTNAVKQNGTALYIGTVNVDIVTTAGLTVTVPVTINTTFTLD